MDTTREISEWREKYITRLMALGKMTRPQAEAVFHAGADSHDFEQCAEQAADDEMSYWESDHDSQVGPDDDSDAVRGGIDHYINGDMQEDDRVDMVNSLAEIIRVAHSGEWKK